MEGEIERETERTREGEKKSISFRMTVKLPNVVIHKYFFEKFVLYPFSKSHTFQGTFNVRLVNAAEN